MMTPRAHGDVLELHCATRATRLAGYAVSAFVVRDVLIDTGFPRIGRALEQWRAARPALRGAILTHWHEDHGGNVERLARAGLPIDADPRTLEALRRNARIGAYRRVTWGAALPLRAPVVPFTDPTLERLATPGHSADHHVVWDHETGSCFGGDLFIAVKVRIAHHEEDHRAMIASLRTIAAREPARYFDAHRGVLTNPVSLLHAKADWLEETVTAIEQRIRNGEPDGVIRRELLGAEDLTGISSFGEYSRRAMVRAIRARMRERGSA